MGVVYLGLGTGWRHTFYMSPEQVLQDPVDGRSDLFSLGVMLYQLTTGSLPFAAGTMDALMHKIVHDAPISRFDVCPDLARTARIWGESSTR